MVTTRLMTAEDLEAMGPEAEKRFELIDGMLVEVNGMGGRQGAISAEITLDLHICICPRRMGRLFSGGTRFILRRNPDLVVMPDISFILAERIPLEGLWENSVPIPPDFAAEIASPDETDTEVRCRTRLYLDAGVRLVWIVWPRQHAVSVFRPGQPELWLTEDDELDGGDVIPGFRLPVASIFVD